MTTDQCARFLETGSSLGTVTLTGTGQGLQRQRAAEGRRLKKIVARCGSIRSDVGQVHGRNVNRGATANRILDEAANGGPGRPPSRIALA